METLKEICGYYKCSSDWLLGLTDNAGAPAVAEERSHYATAPPAPVCSGCADKDKTIAQLSASVAQLAATIGSMSPAEKKSTSHVNAH